MNTEQLKKAMFTSKTDDWSTPDELYDNLNKKYEFNLDPCSSHENAKCKKHFTKEENGLLQDWGGGTESL